LVNVHAMTVATIAFKPELWDQVLSGTSNKKEVRKICSNVNTHAREWLKKTEIDICNRDSKATFKKLKNLRSVSGKSKVILKGLKDIQQKSFI